MSAAPIGILMLETRFPRRKGDVGNAASFGFPVLYETVPAATVARIVGVAPDAALAEPFVAAGERLIARGARALSTSCGFLVLWQKLLEERLRVPVCSSSLLLLPRLEAELAPGARPGVITFDAAALGPQHLRAAGASPGTPVAGLAPGSELYRAIREDRAGFSAGAARRAALEAGERLVRAHPEVGAVVLECTNLGPYREALQSALHRPVHGIVQALEALHARLGDARGAGPIA
jgi:hypothetical protein